MSASSAFRCRVSRVLERHAQAPGKRLQQLPVGLAERMLAIDVLQRDDARPPPSRHERDEESRLRFFSANGASVPLDFRMEVLGDQQ